MVAKGGGEPSARAARLLVKAVRSLPPREQDEVMAALVSAALAPARPTGAVPRARAGPLFPEVGVHLTHPPYEFVNPTSVLPIRLSPPIHARLRKWATDHGFAMAVVVRGLIERFLDEQERKGGVIDR